MRTPAIVSTAIMAKAIGMQPALPGSNSCTWGPSYWCASEANAKECGMTVADCDKYGGISADASVRVAASAMARGVPSASMAEPVPNVPQMDLRLRPATYNNEDLDVTIYDDGYGGATTYNNEDLDVAIYDDGSVTYGGAATYNNEDLDVTIYGGGAPRGGSYGGGSTCGGYRRVLGEYSGYEPDARGGGSPMGGSTYATCPSGYDWGNAGLYCLEYYDSYGNCRSDIFVCNAPYQQPYSPYQRCSYGCTKAPPGSPDSCNRQPSPTPYPTYPTPSPTPKAGTTGCDYIYDCGQCMYQAPYCLWDPNWGRCRPKQECDYTYRPPPVLGYSMEDEVDMNTACYARADQCRTGGGGIIDPNQSADKCTRAESCTQCVTSYTNCYFDTSKNLCVSQCYGYQCVNKYQGAYACPNGR